MYKIFTYLGPFGKGVDQCSGVYTDNWPKTPLPNGSRVVIFLYMVFVRFCVGLIPGMVEIDFYRWGIERSRNFTPRIDFFPNVLFLKILYDMAQIGQK